MKQKINITYCPAVEDPLNPTDRSKKKAPRDKRVQILYNYPILDKLSIKLSSYDPHDIDNEAEEHDMDRREALLDHIYKAVELKLTKKQTIVFLLHFKYGLSRNHISRELNVSQPYVTKCMQKCVDKIKKYIHREEKLCQIKRNKTLMSLKKNSKTISKKMKQQQQPKV